MPLTVSGAETFSVLWSMSPEGNVAERPDTGMLLHSNYGEYY